MLSTLLRERRNVPLPPQTIKHEPETENLTAEVARKGWPLVVCGGAMAGTAWLPENQPLLGFCLLAVEVVCGVYGVVRLISPRAR